MHCPPVPNLPGMQPACTPAALHSKRICFDTPWKSNSHDGVLPEILIDQSCFMLKTCEFVASILEIWPDLLWHPMTKRSRDSLVKVREHQTCYDCCASGQGSRTWDDWQSLWREAWRTIRWCQCTASCIWRQNRLNLARWSQRKVRDGKKQLWDVLSSSKMFWGNNLILRLRAACYFDLCMPHLHTVCMMQIDGKCSIKT